MATRTLVTCALPYANGPIHLGHMVEHIQTDIYVRFLKSRGDDTIFLCADDTHGVPIELNALEQGITPEAFVARWYVEHQRDFADFGIEFDHFGSTHASENQHYAELIYRRAQNAGSILRMEVEQPYDEKAKRWLSDRFILGTCPHCGSVNQYGDACEKCNATYTPRELRDARSSLSGEALVWRKSSHLFFALSQCDAFLRAQLAKPGFIHPSLRAQLQLFFDKGLANWDITRDGPYFGFKIPGEENKFFYVWLDAPIGYIASCEQWAKKTHKAQNALEYWGQESDSRIIHVIGKDIVYFHCLFWPAVLHVAKLKLPDMVHIHGHLTVNGEKMSKTRGTYITARQYLDCCDANYLRFYYALLLGPGPDDLDFNLLEFRQRVNAELVNNLGNLAHRTLSLLARFELETPLAPPTPQRGQALLEQALARVPEIATAFANFNHRAAVKAILEIGYSANQFLTQHAPWKKVRSELEEARIVLSEAAEVVYLLTALIDPIVPRLADALATQLNRPKLTFQALKRASYPLLDRTLPIGQPAPLIRRLEASQVADLIVEKVTSETRHTASLPRNAQQALPSVDIEHFAQLQLKVGKVRTAQQVQRADKLLQLTVDLGESAPRTIVSGIAEAYTPDSIVGKNVIVVANLKSRHVLGIQSHGMILTAGPGGKHVVLLDAPGVPPGSDVQ